MAWRGYLAGLGQSMIRLAKIKKTSAFSSNNVPQLPSDYKPFRMEKDVISKKYANA